MAKKTIFGIIDDLRDGLSELQKALEPLTELAIKTTRKEWKRGKKATRKYVRKNLPKAVKQMRVLQGKYMSAVRALSKAQKEQIKKIRKSKGYNQALSAAKRLARKIA